MRHALSGDGSHFVKAFPDENFEISFLRDGDLVRDFRLCQSPTSKPFGIQGNVQLGQEHQLLHLDDYLIATVFFMPLLALVHGCSPASPPRQQRAFTNHHVCFGTVMKGSS